ncbi:protein CBFA2T1-like [Sinocyclocheilus rhinocerous]|uniref:protein CBFA2T1-like n=1 Tax=Sinocyclocheilus rhinocerous TaxID=307959 RepID=UPI0007B87FD6|nr:PREDICTED: protein CBFA2T1-like [Sinocyclocheilus rhinocerous]
MVGISTSFQYRTEKRSTMPDSPADVKTQSRLTPPTMPPPPTTQGAPRTSSFTPTALTNGTNHSPTALNGAPSPPNGFSNGPSSSSSSSLANQQLPPACGARQLSKLKRFLTTLQQFGNDISPEIGERVRTLVLGLVNSTLTIEEFHSKLQEATNFPLRPFVIPFLKANLPLLQRELVHCARLAKQNPAQYLAQHEQLLLDTSTTSPVDSSELLMDVNENGKRRTPDRTKENGFEREPLHPEHPNKRPCTISPGQRFSPSSGLSYQPNGLPHPTPPPPQHYRLDDMAIAHHYRDSYRHPNHRELRDRPRPLGMHGSTRQEEVIDHRLTDREWAEEWKHLDHLLNCIMDMVEKTRRSLTVLRRCQEADREELNYWIRRYSDAEDLKKTSSSSSSQSRQQSPASQESNALDVHRELLHRPVSGYVPEEIWKKAVRTVADAKRQAAEDALSVINQQEDSSEKERLALDTLPASSGMLRLNNPKKHRCKTPVRIAREPAS